MFKRYMKLIVITCLDFYTIVFGGLFLYIFVSDFIMEFKSYFKLIDRPIMSGPLESLGIISFIVLFVFLVVYLNINEYKKSKIEK